MKLSVVVLAKNEESRIGDCIESVSFCEEIIVIDDYSIDDTVKIARKKGCRVYQKNLNGDFALQRNFGLKKAKYGWVLFVDADERVSAGLEDEIVNAVSDPNQKSQGFYIKRMDNVWGKLLLHGEAGNTQLIRLGRKGAGLWKRSVHEEWEIKGQIGKLAHYLYHYPHDNVFDFIANVNFYSSLHGRQNDKEGKKSNLVKIIVVPSAKFFYNFFWLRGILDGMHGLVHAFHMSFHSFLAWSKLWVYQKGEQK